MAKLAILHTSDWHVGPDAAASHVFDKFIECLEQLGSADLPDVPRPRLAVVTGDLVHQGGDDSAYDKVEQRLARMRDALDLAPDRVFCVPGNHEVEWPMLTGSLYQLGIETAAGKRDQDGLSLSTLRAKNDQLYQVISGAMRRTEAWWTAGEPADPEHGWPLERHCDIVEDGIHIRLCGLNSAIIAGPRDDNRDDEHLHDRYVDLASLEAMTEALPRSTMPIICTHYPLDWVDNANERRPRLMEILRSRFALVLHGHVHEDRAHNDSGHTEAQCIALGAGALTQPPDNAPRIHRHQFQVILLDTEAKHLQVCTFEWKDPGFWHCLGTRNKGSPDWWSHWCGPGPPPPPPPDQDILALLANHMPRDITDIIAHCEPRGHTPADIREATQRLCLDDRIEHITGTTRYWMPR